MNAVDEILNQIPVEELASKLGTDTDTVRQAAATAIPDLIQQLQSNAAAGHEQAVAGELDSHARRGLLDGGLSSIDDVDASEGQRLLGEMYGGTDHAVEQIGQRQQFAGGAAVSGILKSLLPYLLPIVMSWVAGKLGGQQQSQAGGSGNILADILGGMAGQQSQQSGGGVLADVLGGLLGGGATQQGVQGQAPASTPQFDTTAAPTDGGIGDVKLDEGGTTDSSRPSDGGLVGAIKDMFGKK